jgi:hypothetical protein
VEINAIDNGFSLTDDQCICLLWSDLKNYPPDYFFRLPYFLSFITMGEQRVTNTPFFTVCPTIIDSNKKVLKRKQI